jgi:hypothetical protein
MEMNEYKPADIVPETSSLYRVVALPTAREREYENILKHFIPATIFHLAQNAG